MATFFQTQERSAVYISSFSFHDVSYLQKVVKGLWTNTINRQTAKICHFWHHNFIWYEEWECFIWLFWLFIRFFRLTLLRIYLLSHGNVYLQSPGRSWTLHGPQELQGGGWAPFLAFPLSGPGCRLLPEQGVLISPHPRTHPSQADPHPSLSSEGNTSKQDPAAFTW